MRSPDWGQAGNRTGDTGLAPSKIRTVKTSSSHSCAINDSGALYCWGNNNSGQVMPPPEWTPQTVRRPSSASLSTIDTAPSSPTLYDPIHRKTITSLSAQSSSLVSVKHFCMIVGDNIPPKGNVVCLGKADPMQLLGGAGSDGVLPAPNGMRFTRVKTGKQVTCALGADGALYCAGVSPALPGGVSSTLTRLEWGLASSVVIDFAVGDGHICAIHQNEKLYCWGDNSEGQVGPQGGSIDQLPDGTLDPFTQVIESQTIDNFTQVFASDTQTCAIAKNEQIYCWGRNTGPPRRVSNLGWKVVSASLGPFHNCLIYNEGVTVSGRVACAGANMNGQLGLGYSSVMFPVPATGDLSPVLRTPGVQLANVVQVSVGLQNTCAVDGTNKVWCWGENSSAYEIDQPTPAVYPFALLTRTSSNAEQVVTGSGFTCVVRTDGSLTCNGINVFQQIQEPMSVTTEFLSSTTVLGPHLFGSSIPMPLGFQLQPIIHPLSSNKASTCASVSEEGGRLYCWGSMLDLNLPDQPTSKIYQSPVPIPGLEDGVTSVSLGKEHACAIRAGALYCWGNNQSGQVNGKWVSDPGAAGSVIVLPQLIFRSGVSAVAAGGDHTCAVVVDQVMCWGANQVGQVGAGRVSKNIPYPVAVLQGPIVALTAGANHTCAIQGPSPGTIFCWGDGSKGQLGLGTTAFDRPTLISLNPALGVYDPVEIVAGDYHTCMKALNGSLEPHLLCTGRNDHGQIGLPIGVPQQESFVRPNGLVLADTTAIAASGELTCLVADTPGIMHDFQCMGNNTSGQRAIGYPTQPGAPGTESIRMVDPSAILHLAPGTNHLCFSEGNVLCVGSNANGQLGNGSQFQLAFYSPQLVLDGGVTDVTLGSEHTCALKEGNLHCWGSNQAHQLPVIDPATPYLVSATTPLVSGVSHVATKGDTVCMVRNREVRCWGQNANGTLGLDSNTTQLTYVDSIASPPIFSQDISQLVVGQTNTCAVLMDGALWCWGQNDKEQIAPTGEVGGPGWVIQPFHVNTNSTSVAKVIAEETLCWVGMDGSLGCRGNVPFATEVNNLSAQISPVADLISGADALCALTKSGEIYCGGNNSDQILDPNAPQTTNLPFRKVRNGFEVTSFSISNFHGCGVEAGILKCWGDNKEGALGIGEVDLGIHLTPIEVVFP